MRVCVCVCACVCVHVCVCVCVCGWVGVLICIAVAVDTTASGPATYIILQRQLSRVGAGSLTMRVRAKIHADASGNVVQQLRQVETIL